MQNYWLYFQQLKKALVKTLQLNKFIYSSQQLIDLLHIFLISLVIYFQLYTQIFIIRFLGKKNQVVTFFKYLMLNTMKCFSSFGSIIMLLLGFSITGVTIYAFLNQEIFFSDEDLKHVILNSLIIVSSVVIVVAILGIVGVVRKNCCLIFIYQIFVFIFLAIFLTLGVGTKILPDKVFPGNCTDSSNDLVKLGNSVYNYSRTNFCNVNSACGCSLTDDAISLYTDDEKATLRSYNINLLTGVNATQACADFQNTAKPQEKVMADTVGQIQLFLKCSSWCQGTEKDNLIYRFSNVNNGKPESYCYPTLKDSFFHYANVMGITCFCIAAVFFLVCVCNICLCCHPQRKQLQFRDRFIYVGGTPTQRGYQKYN